jgi:hypothetical protein
MWCDNVMHVNHCSPHLCSSHSNTRPTLAACVASTLHGACGPARRVIVRHDDRGVTVLALVEELRRRRCHVATPSCLRQPPFAFEAQREVGRQALVCRASPGPGMEQQRERVLPAAAVSIASAAAARRAKRG